MAQGLDLHPTLYANIWARAWAPRPMQGLPAVEPRRGQQLGHGAHALGPGPLGLGPAIEV